MDTQQGLKMIPIHEQTRRTSINRELEELNRLRKLSEWRFQQNIKGELVGSPRYELAFWNMQREYRQILEDEYALKELLPPYLIWRSDLGCLEHIAKGGRQ